MTQANIIPPRLLEHGHLGVDDMDGINGMDGVNRSSEKLASAIPSYGHTLFRKNAAMVKSCIPDKVDAMELIEESYKFAYTWFPVCPQFIPVMQYHASSTSRLSLTLTILVPPDFRQNLFALRHRKLPHLPLTQ